MSLADIDLSLFLLINQSLQNPFFDLLMPFVTKNGPLIMLPGIIWFFAKERHSLWMPLAVALAAVALGDAGSHLLKDLIARPRPCAVLENVHLLVGCGKAFSMPSNHASNSFAFACALLLFRRTGPSFLLLGVAFLVGFSRVSVGVHYPSDVLAGGVVGLCAALAARAIADRLRSAYERRGYAELLVIILAIISLARAYFILTGPYDLSADEAHYWEWSRRLDFGYYSKGPMIAWLIALGTAVFGDTAFGVRIFAVAFSGLSSWLLYMTARDLYDEKTGFFSGLLLQVIPLFSTYGVIFTIDSPLIFFWTLSFFLFQRIVFRADRLEKASFDPHWLLLGVAMGLGMMTKHSIALFPMTAFLYLLVSKDLRPVLRTAGPYVSSALAFFIYSPVIVWNAAHGWVTFKHTAGQAHLREGIAFSPESLLDFIGSQLGVMTPIVLVLMLVSLWKLRKEPGGRMLFWLSMPILAFFALKSAQAKVQANWALAGYLPGIIAFSVIYLKDYGSLGSRMKGLVLSGTALALVATVLPFAPSLINRLPDKLDPTARLTGWKEVGPEVAKAVAEMEASGPVFLFSDTYQVASELAFYVPGHPVTYCFNNNRRMNQYDLWPGLDGFTGRNAVLVRHADRLLPAGIARVFGRCDREVLEVKARRGNKVNFTVFRCYDFKGMDNKPIEKF